MSILYKKPTDIVVNGGGSEQTDCVRQGTTFTCCGMSLVNTAFINDDLSQYVEHTDDGIIITNTSGRTIEFQTEWTELKSGFYFLINNGSDLLTSRIYVQIDSEDDYSNYIQGSRRSTTFEIVDPARVRLVFRTLGSENPLVIKPIVTTNNCYSYYACYYDYLYQPYTSCGTLISPCNLYEGDKWHPITGQVVRNNGMVEQYPAQPISNASKFWNVYQNPFQRRESDGLIAFIQIEDFYPTEVKDAYRIVGGVPVPVMMCKVVKNVITESVFTNLLDPASEYEEEFYTSDGNEFYTRENKQFIVRSEYGEIQI